MHGDWGGSHAPAIYTKYIVSTELMVVFSYLLAEGFRASQLCCRDAI